QNFSVYFGDIAKELNSLREALEDGSSVKLKTRDAAVRGSPGFGTTKIAAGLHALGAFAVLRTGRVLAYFDSTAEESAFVVHDTRLGYFPGTVLQVVFPRRVARVWDTQ